MLTFKEFVPWWCCNIQVGQSHSETEWFCSYRFWHLKTLYAFALSVFYVAENDLSQFQY